ncbi:uncharacterized protein LOC142572800 isoform X2 [Dermacentor variabilis]|uniref:uncharacterized protein LOC142572800 isoform X2 n=1 Tax=Dermacentor variabilis TaxID=34621 RepID=UPI003F5B80A8
MAVPENARAGQQPDRPKDPHASTLFFTALAHEQPPGRGNAAAAGRRASVPTFAAASQNWRHSKRQHDDVPRQTRTPEQRRAAFTTRSVQPGHALPHTLEKTAPLAGKLVAATTEGLPNPASAAPVGHEERPPSMRLATGGVQAVGGHEEDAPEGAVACVLVCMCFVVFAIAGLLIYVYRSLSTGPPQMEPCTYEETALTATKPSVATEVHERGATGIPLLPLGSRRATALASPGPKARGRGASESAGTTSGSVRTDDAQERGDDRKQAGDTAVPAPAKTTTPGEDRRPFELVVFVAPACDGRLSNGSYEDRRREYKGHLEHRGLGRRVG